MIAERGSDGPGAADSGEGAGEDDELADETAEHGQADHGQRRNHEVGGCAGQFGGEAAVRIDEAGGVADFERAEKQEERAINDSMRKNLIDAAGPAEESEAVDGENDEARGG